MNTYIALIDFTEQGIRDIKKTSSRAELFKDAAQKAGVVVREIFWTLGAHDGVLILESPDDESVTAALLDLGRQGNVRSQTLRAFDRSAIGPILSKLS